MDEVYESIDSSETDNNYTNKTTSEHDLIRITARKYSL